jgi:hypothetical protein
MASIRVVIVGNLRCTSFLIRVKELKDSKFLSTGFYQDG